MLFHLLKLLCIFGFIFCLTLHVPIQTIRSATSIKPLLSVTKNNFYPEYLSSEIQVANISQKFIYPTNSLENSTTYNLFQLEKQKFYSLGFFPKSSEIFTKQSRFGYITHPDSFSYFIWYPKIGNLVSFFDKNLNLLWSKTESRYIKIFPNGDYLLAITGDQSQFKILDIELSSLFSYSGLLLNHYQLFSSQENSSEKWNSCFAFLNGDFLLINAQSKNFYLYHHNHMIKSTFCEPQQQIILLHTYDIEKNQDFIEVHSISNDSFKKQNKPILLNSLIKPITFKLQQTISLSKVIPSKIPLITTKDFFVYATTKNEHSINLSFFNYHIKKIQNIHVIIPKPFILENFTFQVIQELIVFSNSFYMAIFDSQGLLFQKTFDQILNIKINKNTLFVQEKSKIVSYIIQ